MKKIEIGDNLFCCMVFVALFAAIAILGLSACVPGTCSSQIDLDEALPHYSQPYIK